MRMLDVDIDYFEAAVRGYTVGATPIHFRLSGGTGAAAKLGPRPFGSGRAAFSVVLLGH